MEERHLPAPDFDDRTAGDPSYDVNTAPAPAPRTTLDDEAAGRLALQAVGEVRRAVDTSVAAVTLSLRQLVREVDKAADRGPSRFLFLVGSLLLVAAFALKLEIAIVRFGALETVEFLGVLLLAGVLILTAVITRTAAETAAHRVEEGVGRSLAELPRGLAQPYVSVFEAMASGLNLRPVETADPIQAPSGLDAR